MDGQVIYRKTAKGQEEMATRAYRLPARERSLLVLVDGRTATRQLLEKSRHLGDSEAFLERLISAGFIERIVGDNSAQTLPPAVAPDARQEPVLVAKSALPSGSTSMSAAARKEVIDFARLFLFDTLGPDADSLAARIEASRNQNELVAALEKGRDALQAIAGRRKAETFWQGLIARLPLIETLTSR